MARALAADPPVLLMDEPFAAVDPIARARLQDEFLRLQERGRKTIVFVTHDIDEAVRLGDRIAVLRQGGQLEQYADPATLLGAPANDFVADFVGSDRGLRRLAVPTSTRATSSSPRSYTSTTPWRRPAGRWPRRAPAGPSSCARTASCAAGSPADGADGDGDGRRPRPPDAGLGPGPTRR